MDRIDFYELLGVKRTASALEIRRAYRKLARKYHPDINPGDRAAEVRYQRISEAFAVLADAEERERYDRRGWAPLAEPAPSYGFEGFDFTAAGPPDADIFPELFGPELFGRHGASGPYQEGQETELAERAARGESLLHHLTMSFDESLRGLETSFQVRRQIACRSCSGWGQRASGERQPCPACGGTGRLTQSRGHMVFARPCGECGGAGTIDRRPCPDCGGAGRAPVEETVRVRIPAGVDDGAKLRVPGKGNEGRGGAPAGELFVHIQVTPDGFFSREGDHLHCTVPITFTEAALGCRIEIPTPEGPVKLRVPAGTQSGQILRLSGRGAPSPRGRSVRGDLHVTIQVVTPTVYDQKSQELLRELQRLHPENPRQARFRGAARAQTVSGESS